MWICVGACAPRESEGRRMHGTSVEVLLILERDCFLNRKKKKRADSE